MKFLAVYTIIHTDHLHRADEVTGSQSVCSSMHGDSIILWERPFRI
jgi:hypothetical protein